VTGALPAVIAGTGSELPARVVHTRDVVAQAFPEALPEQRARVAEKSGIETRRWLAPPETAASLASAALRRALERSGVAPAELRRIIFVSSTGGDHLVPATAHDVAGAFGLSETCDAFDMSNSCVGFLSALDVAGRSIATGIGPAAVVAAETFSRQLSPEGARAYVVLGDAAAAAVLRRAETGGILASCLRTSERLRGKMRTALPGTPGARGFHDFDARSHELTESAVACIGAAIDDVLKKVRMSLADVPWVVVHQPNGSLFASLLERLGVDPARTINVVREIGSVGAASVAFGLDRLLRSRTFQPGERILIASVGAGTAYGALLYEVGE
jgi:3-oxoacyl-(acyl-carrier-protein) synthase III